MKKRTKRRGRKGEGARKGNALSLKIRVDSEGWFDLLSRLNNVKQTKLNHKSTERERRKYKEGQPRKEVKNDEISIFLPECAFQLAK